MDMLLLGGSPSRQAEKALAGPAIGGNIGRKVEDEVAGEILAQGCPSRISRFVSRRSRAPQHGERNMTARFLTSGSTALVLAVALVAGALSCPARADEAVDELIQDIIRGARTNSDRAVKLLSAGETAGDSKELRIVLLEKAVELAIKSRKTEGLVAGERALELLAEDAPERTDAWTLKKADLYRNWQKVRRRASEKHEIGAKLIDALADAGLVHERARQWTRAVGIYREAVSLAARLRHSDKKELTKSLRRAQHSARLQKQVESLGKLLEKDPDRTATRTSLLKLLVIDLDDPGRAAKHLAADVEEQWRTYVPVAAREPNDLAPEVCRELGDWYYGQLFPEADSRAKRNVLRRAKTYYETFGRKYTNKDAVALRVKLALVKVDEELEKLGGAPRVRNVVGMVCAAADDIYQLRINGRIVIEGNYGSKKSAKVVLNPNDLITVKLRDVGGGWGFCFLFRGKDPGVEFSTIQQSWFIYRPRSAKAWWKVSPGKKAPPAQPGTNSGIQQIVRELAKRVPTTPCQIIWGVGKDCFLYHVVTNEELSRNNLKWVSRDATYTASSMWDRHKPLPALLTGEGELHQRAYAFHTNRESNPHIIIKLKRSVGIKRIMIENVRGGARERSKGMVVLVSSDRKQWKRIWKGGNAQPVWIIDLKTPVRAKYVKIGLPRTEYFHLAGVRIYAK